jgi:hypothetical protein
MPRTNRKGLLWSLALAALFFAAFGAAQATTINARSPSVTDVKTAIASAADGDTVIVPAGTAVWRSTLTVDKGITLQGQTTTDSTNGTAVDNTIIQDSDARRRPGGSPFIIVASQLGKSYRITGLTFDGGSATVTNYNGAIQLAGNSHSVRLDHCNFRPSLRKQAHWVAIIGAIWGVADHNIFKFQGKGVGGQESFYIYMDNWPNPDGTAGVNGDGAFAQPTDFGTEKFFFIEDNWLQTVSGTEPTGGPDDLKGGRWVWRHNHMYNSQVQSHGTEDGRWRGGRAREVYNNDFHATATFGAGGIRSGVTVFHDNTFDGVAPGQSGYQLQAYRLMFGWPSCPFRGATGDNPWDVNVTETDGTHVDGHPPYLFDSGTATGGSGSQIIDTTKNWTANQWTDYTAKFTGDNQVGLIQSNTNNTLNVYFYTDSGGGHVWRAGDGYQIHKVLIALDQPSRGKGDLITGDRPTPVGWPHQALEPSYSWNNVYTPTGAHVNFTVGTAGTTLKQGRDYFNNTPMPGYTPYVYPHPLTRGLPPPEQMTRNAPGNSQHDPHKKRRPWGGKKPERKQANKAKESSTNKMPEGQENVDN